jgi:hypothetical protein
MGMLIADKVGCIIEGYIYKDHIRDSYYVLKDFMLADYRVVCFSEDTIIFDPEVLLLNGYND